MEILMTAYKSQKYIKETLKSIPDYIPIIVGVDGCKDTLNELLNIRSEFNNLKILWCPENNGTYVTRNTLLEQTDSDIVIFLDSDDIYTEELFKKIKQNIKNYDIIRWSYYVLYGANFSAPQKNTHYYHANGVFACRRDVFKALGGYKGWRYSADYDLQVRINNMNLKVLKLDDNLMFYRQHESSLTRTVPIHERRQKEQQIGGDWVKPITHGTFELL